MFMSIFISIQIISTSMYVSVCVCIHVEKQFQGDCNEETNQTLSFENMRTPLATSMNASFWGVVTITAAVNGTTWKYILFSWIAEIKHRRCHAKSTFQQSLFLFFLHMPTDNYNSHQQQLKAKAHSTGNISWAMKVKTHTISQKINK